MMAIDREIQVRWILGETIPGVSFKMQEDVEIVYGPHQGTIGELISLYEVEPEPVYILETREGHDLYVHQSEILPV